MELFSGPLNFWHVEKNDAQGEPEVGDNENRLCDM